MSIACALALFLPCNIFVLKSRIGYISCLPVIFKDVPQNCYTIILFDFQCFDARIVL